MLVSALALGVLAGGIGGDWRRLGALRIRAWGVLLIGITLRILATALSLPVSVFLMALLAISVVAVLNRDIPGMKAVAVGVFLNIAVIAANAGMPISEDAVRAAGAAMPTDSLHVPLTMHTTFGALGDVIPVPLVRNVYSPGDFVIALGAFWGPFRWLRR